MYYSTLKQTHLCTYIMYCFFISSTLRNALLSRKKSSCFNLCSRCFLLFSPPLSCSANMQIWSLTFVLYLSNKSMCLFRLVVVTDELKKKKKI